MSGCSLIGAVATKPGRIHEPDHASRLVYVPVKRTQNNQAELIACCHGLGGLSVTTDICICFPRLQVIDGPSLCFAADSYY
jgi:hypothetical protein